MHRRLRRLRRRKALRYMRRELKQRQVRRPRHRRYLVLIVAAVILGYAIIYCFLGAPLGDFNPMRGQYNAIHSGMSVEQVEEILGRPNFSDFPEQKIWTSDRGGIIVDFDGRRVCGKEFKPIKLPRRIPPPW